jgi:hypothetical protein
MDDLILLHDSPPHRGEQLGLCQKVLLKQRLATFKALCEKQNLGPLELPDRARQITTTLNVLCMEWLIEARAVASAAQVPAATFVSVTYPPERVQPCLIPKRANDSTAMATRCVGPAKTLFMENCDGPEIVHHVISRASSPGTLAYIALAEAADIGIKSFVNEAGVAGTFHMGPQVEDYTNSATQPTLLLRQICEVATSCAQAVSEFNSLQKRLGSATPDKRGICYLFSDSSGDMMLLEATGSRYTHYRVAEGFLSTTNKFQLSTMQQTSIEPFRQRCIREQLGAGHVDLKRVLQTSRCDRRAGSEKGICDGDTRASFLAVLGTTGFPSYALVTLGTPLHNFPIPLFPRIGAPREMVDGTTWSKAFRTPDPTGVRNQKRDAYDAFMLKRLSSIPANATDDVLMAVTLDCWKLATQYIQELPPAATASSATTTATAASA